VSNLLLLPCLLPSFLAIRSVAFTTKEESERATHRTNRTDVVKLVQPTECSLQSQLHKHLHPSSEHGRHTIHNLSSKHSCKSGLLISRNIDPPQLRRDHCRPPPIASRRSTRRSIDGVSVKTHLIHRSRLSAHSTGCGRAVLESHQFVTT
jgi:hypothetical protein